jgi:putative membrane protein
MRAAELLTPRIADAVERAVQEAERRTSGEIVPVVVDRSASYGGARAAAAALVAFAVGPLVLLLPADPWLALPPAQAAIFGLGFWLAGRAPLLRWLLPRSVEEQRVARAARLAFVQHRLHETRERTGILIYVSLAEHRVCVLADRGIHARVEQGPWDGVVRLIVDGVRAGRPDEGLLRAIQSCGDLLAAHFPRRPDDANELANQLRTPPSKD